MRRPRHEQSLRKSRLRPSLRVNPMELAFRAVLFGQVPRHLQRPVGTQPRLLEMALQLPWLIADRTPANNPVLLVPNTGELTLRRIFWQRQLFAPARAPSRWRTRVLVARLWLSSIIQGTQPIKIEITVRSNAARTPADPRPRRGTSRHIPAGPRMRSPMRISRGPWPVRFSAFSSGVLPARDPVWPSKLPNSAAERLAPWEFLGRTRSIGRA
jgi:hypothetical protein